MNMYTITLTDESGCEDKHAIHSDTDDDAKVEARESAQELAVDSCSGGEWGTDGASVEVRWSLRKSGAGEIDGGTVTVEISPDHRALILDAGPWGGSCGLDPEAHEWTADGEGGCDENPGVWATGGTAMSFSSHCRACGLHRTEHHVGSQRNPGEHDTVVYEFTGCV